MGGSGIGGDLARAALGDRLGLPLTTVRDYELAPWTPPDRVVLCASYSGNTEETLAAFEAASAVGAKRVVATTGGALGDAAREADVPVIPFPAALQPRAAVGYMFVAAAEVAALAGVAPAIRTEIDYIRYAAAKGTPDPRAFKSVTGDRISRAARPSRGRMPARHRGTAVPRRASRRARTARRRG